MDLELFGLYILAGLALSFIIYSVMISDEPELEQLIPVRVKPELKVIKGGKSGDK